jgi:hypothetical protein
MIPRKATAVLFLCFTIIVAFFNILIGKYQHTLFIIPFALACVLNGRKSKIFEIAGLMSVFFYLMIWSNEEIGIMGLIITSVFMFSLTQKLRTSRIYIYATAALIFSVSYIRFNGGADRAVHAMLDTMFFLVGSGSLYCVIYRALHDAKTNDKPLGQKYLDTLYGFQAALHEAIEEIKRIQGGKS